MIQNGTNHSWQTTAGKSIKMMCNLVDAKTVTAGGDTVDGESDAANRIGDKSFGQLKM